MITVINFWRNMNYSVQNEIILKTLKDNAVHPTAETLCKIIREENPKIGVATVYRNLNKLADKGIIKRIDRLESATHFDHNTTEHYHVICDKCKKVFDVFENISPEIIAKAEIETGYKITSYDILLHGICKECQEKENTNQ